MNSLYLLLGGLALLGLGYFVYGAWLEKVWGVDPSRPTPAHQFRDGVDYMPSKAPVVLGHHFSSIAGAGPTAWRKSSARRRRSITSLKATIPPAATS